MDNTIEYDDPMKEFLSLVTRSIYSMLERKYWCINVLKAKFEEFNILDKYIKEENAPLKDRCVKL